MADFDPNDTTQATGDTGATQVPATQGTPAPAATQQENTQPQATQGGPHGTQGMVPSYRLREYAERIRALEAELNEHKPYRTKAEQYESQIRALVGVQKPSEEDSQADVVRQQFFKVFPWAKTYEDSHEKFQKLLDLSEQLEQQNNHYWRSYGQTSVDRLYEQANQVYGDQLTETGKSLLYYTLNGLVQNNPEAAARYENDPKFVQEFWKAFSSNLIDPVKRTATAATAQRAPKGLPQDTPAGVPVTQGPKPSNLDERVAQAWSVFDNRNK